MLGTLKRGKEKRGTKLGAPRFATIADIGKERIRRVIAKLRSDQRPGEDLGFRVFKQADSNFRDVDPAAYVRNGRLIVDPLKPGWEPLAVVWEIALSEGLPLTSQVNCATKRRGKQSQTAYAVMDATPGHEQAVLVCLDPVVWPWFPKAFELHRFLGLLVICRDCAISEAVGRKLETQCQLRVF